MAGPLRPPRVVVFDWDGTLVDSTQTIAQAIRLSCQDLGIAVPSLKDAQYVIGLGLQDALRRVAPDLPPERAPELSLRFRHHYLSRDHLLEPFEGIRPLLQDLQSAGVVMTVATGKSRQGLERALDSTQTRAFFAYSRCADESVPKPGPEMVLEICDYLDCDPRDALVVGDTTHDIQMAHSAGAQAVAVGYGAHDPESLRRLSPLDCLESVPALDRWIRAHILGFSQPPAAPAAPY
jgi:phosphoglycolate phosphatase